MGFLFHFDKVELGPHINDSCELVARGVSYERLSTDSTLKVGMFICNACTDCTVGKMTKLEIKRQANLSLDLGNAYDLIAEDLASSTIVNRQDPCRKITQ